MQELNCPTRRVGHAWDKKTLGQRVTWDSGKKTAREQTFPGRIFDQLSILPCDRRKVAGLAKMECLKSSIGASQDVPVPVGRPKNCNVGLSVFVVVARNR